MNRERMWSQAVATSASRRGAEQWKCLPWWKKAAMCCAQPTIFYVLMFVGIGILFVAGAPLLDPDLAVIGLILIGVGFAMMLVYGLLAYRSFGGRHAGSPDCRSDR